MLRLVPYKPLTVLFMLPEGMIFLEVQLQHKCNVTAIMELKHKEALLSLAGLQRGQRRSVTETELKLARKTRHSLDVK